MDKIRYFVKLILFVKINLKLMALVYKLVVKEKQTVFAEKIKSFALKIKITVSYL